MVDVLVLNYNDATSTLAYIDKIKDYDSVRKILIVDNCSTDNSVQLLYGITSDKVDVIVSKQNGGYGAGNNFGIQYLVDKYNSEYILLTNPDVLVENETIKSTEQFLREHLDYVIAAPFMLNTKGEKQINTAFRIPKLWDYILSFGIVWSKYISRCWYKDILCTQENYKEVDGVTGSMLMMNANEMLEFGMYDERIFLYCEEISLALKLKKAGRKTALLPQLKFVHNHSISISKSFNTEVKRHRLMVKSKLYVIAHYYNASKATFIIAWLMSRISLVEVFLWANIRRRVVD